MTSAGVPVIAGYHGEDQSTERLQMEADQIGFPLMIKAVRGGGGKGMRVARTADEFAVQLASARREALKSFGDDVMLLETFVQHPRHVEVQIFGDHYGNYVHLFERDCSVQRRHQKVIEEAPAPGLSDTLRAELGQAAVRAAQAVAYVGAGTVEFIVDCHTHAFHFMEMNTRLQVEHPVTEMVTGLDLVEWQLQVASGLPLPLRQEEIQVRGHAFEARIYAESPDEDFLPGAGRLYYLASPEAQADVRIETGVRQGDEVSVYYDPMIAKLVVWGDTRQTALQKLRARLAEYNIVGLNTNVDFLVQLSDNPDFLCGEVHTGFIEQHHKQLFPARSVDPQHLMQAALAVVLHEELQSAAAAICSTDPFSPFVLAKGNRLNHLLVRTLTLKHKEKAVPIQVTYLAEKQYGLQIDGSPSPVLMSGSLTKTNQGLNLTCIMDGVCRHSRVVIRDGDIHLFTKDGSCHLTLPEPTFLAEQFSADGLAKDSGVAAPMPGLVDKVFVSKGQSVAMGDPLLVVIAMKMEHVIRAPRAAVVDEVLCQIGDNISKNATVVTFVEQC